MRSSGLPIERGVRRGCLNPYLEEELNHNLYLGHVDPAGSIQMEELDAAQVWDTHPARAIDAKKAMLGFTKAVGV
jgi:hypothetical protein